MSPCKHLTDGQNFDCQDRSIIASLCKTQLKTSMQEQYKTKFLKFAQVTAYNLVILMTISTIFTYQCVMQFDMRHLMALKGGATTRYVSLDCSCTEIFNYVVLTVTCRVAFVCIQDKQEQKYRNGEVSYADREYKFTS